MATVSTPPLPLVTPPSVKPSAVRGRRQYRWTYAEYQRLAAAGFLRRGRVELIGGRLIRMAAQGDLHVISVDLTKARLSAAFGSGFWVRDQAPLHIDHWSGPEPDAAVVLGSPRDYVGKGHPRSALLVVEVSDTTLLADRRRKGPRYARAGCADYWIVNLIDRQLEVYRRPVADPSALLGWRYADVSVLTPTGAVAPLALPGVLIPVADFLP